MRSYRVLTPRQCQRIVSNIKALDWHAGKSMREHGKIKQNRELTGEDAVAEVSLKEIRKGLDESAISQREYVSKVYPPKFNRYGVGESYGIHTDASYMGGYGRGVRTDLACTIFLNDDFEGGRLFVEDYFPNGKAMPIQAQAGMAVVYACGRPHWVEPVTQGERFCAVCWFESRIPEPTHREILNRLHWVIHDVEKPEMTDQERFARLGSVHAMLVKEFSR